VSERSVRRSRQLSAITALALPTWSAGPQRFDDIVPAALDAGYEGIQVFLPVQASAAREAGMRDASGIGQARTATDVDTLLELWAGSDGSSVTVHLGTGFETEAEGLALVEHALRAAERTGVTMLVETHRATITQDPARTLALVERFPELRFTADLSHWYTGVELVYGDLEAKLALLAPVFERTRMVHGRISDPGCIQVAVRDDDPVEHVEHFRRMWRTILAACEAEGVPSLPFVVELLPAGAHYARTVDRGDGPEEEVDRWAQADVLWSIFDNLTTTP
jgi:sugar phosphate isomerase/epimerase